MTRRRAVRKVCILTGGGDAPGLNAVLRGFVTAAATHDFQVVGSEDGFDGLITDAPLRPLDANAVRGILPLGGSVLGCSNRANPFAYPTTRGRTIDVSKRVIDRIAAERIDALVVVGGDGSMAHANAFTKLGIKVVGVPKTIDNDLAATERTFGYETAVQTATWAIDALHTTAHAHERVMVLEVMGRDAGWIALSAGIAGGADVVLIPEAAYDLDRVVDKIDRRTREGRRFSIVVVGEGARLRGKERSIVTPGRKGHLPRLGGAGPLLADLLCARIDHEVRVTVLGHVQRGGSPCAFDRILATRFGVEAARLCAEHRFGKMVSLHGDEIRAVPIARVVQRGKRVPLRGELVRTAQDMGIELGFAP